MKKKKKKPKKPMYRTVLLALLGLSLTGCAGSIGWDRATPLPQGSYRESRGGPVEFYSWPSPTSQPCQ